PSVTLDARLVGEARPPRFLTKLVFLVDCQKFHAAPIEIAAPIERELSVRRRPLSLWRTESSRCDLPRFGLLKHALKHLLEAGPASPDHLIGELSNSPTVRTRDQVSSYHPTC